MTPKERAITAFNLGTPDMVPTLELEFQLEEEMFGRTYATENLKPENFYKLGEKDREKELFSLAEFMTHVFTELEYSIIPGPYIELTGTPFWRDSIISDELKTIFKYLKEMNGERLMLAFHGDGTYSIPDGNGMYDFAYKMVDAPEELKEHAEKMADKAIERNKLLMESGVECLLLCSDYCYNSGPFLSPENFGEFIQPYLYKIIKSARENGQYTIKHTDGNIMPILNQMVDCKPHALHSIDPMAGVDIREVKRLVGDKVCLIGNVHCAAIQTGTEEEVVASAEYCLTHAKPGGGYIFSTSNCPFKGMPLERYNLVRSVWKRMRDY